MAYVRFDTVAELLAHCEKRAEYIAAHKDAPNGERPDGSGDSSVTGSNREEWTMGASFKKAIKLARGGWAEGAARFIDGMSAIDATGTADKSRMYRDVAGASPCVGAAVSGHPLSMYRRRREPVATRTLAVYVDCTAPASCDAEYMCNRGIAIASWIDAMESSGVRVELTLTHTSTDSPKATQDGAYGRADADAQPTNVHVVETVLKGAGEALDVDRVAFFLGHPATLRRLMFAVSESDNNAAGDGWAKQSRYGYGMPSLYRAAAADVAAGCVVLQGITRDAGDYHSIEAARDRVNRDIEKQRDAAARGAK
jgi:hypothetical protein